MSAKQQQPKRNAAQAFVEQAGSADSEHAQHATKRQKKQKSHKRGSSGPDDDAAAQLLREELESSQQQNTSLQREEEDAAQSKAGKSRKERKRERKSKIGGVDEVVGEVKTGKSVKQEARSSRQGVAESDSPAVVKKESPKATKVASGESAAATAAPPGDGEVSKSKKRKRDRAQRKLDEEEQLQRAAQRTQAGENDGVEAESQSRLSKREKKRLKEKLKKGVPLEDRIEDPKDVDPEEIKGDEDDEDETELSVVEDGVAKLQEGTPLEDRIEPPPPFMKKGKKAREKHLAGGEGWSLSKATGGTFIDQDPIMTGDEKYLILATASEVRVYSAATSLLVRSMRTHDTIVCSAVSKVDPSRLIAGRGDGKIVMWDWTTGTKIREWRSPTRLMSLAPSFIKDADGSETIVALYGGDDGERHLTVYALGDAKQVRHVQTLLTRKGLNPQFQLHEDAGVVVASAYNRLIIGSAKDLRSTSYSDSVFTWREFLVVGGIISVDTRSYSVGQKSTRNRLDIAVGTKSGTVNLYEDLLFKLVGKEKKKQDDDMPVAFRSLNWHRTAVNTVKWSKDGSYIISGGNETVLVIWQLDTNKQQFLPHLSTEIKRLVVSNRGSSYTLLLGDNSVMVLSTADLNPTANIALLGAVGTGNMSAAIHPTKQGHLLTAMPRSIAPVRADQATALQTYDVQADMQIARQALTRNLTTTINIGPDGQPLKEPNVSQLRLSFDGAWLVTVEEWNPQTSSLDALHLQDDDVRKNTTETTLKFWSAADEGNDWALTNRVDCPYGASRIIALVPCPIRAEFATISSDGIVQTWVPRARRRDGVLVKGSRDQILYNWHVSRKIPLNPAHTVKAASLAYAEDGSLISASLSTISSAAQWTSLIPLTTSSLDPASIQHVPALHPGAAIFLSSAFVGPYLITLSSATISVYDTINATTLRTISFEGSDFDLSNPSAQSTPLTYKHLLAANPLDGTFALVLNPAESYLPSRLLVLSLRCNEVSLSLPDSNNDDEQAASKSPIRYDATLPSLVTALLPHSSAPGYVLVDASASAREVRGPGPGASRSAFSSAAAVAVEDDSLRRGLDALFGAGHTSSSGTAQPAMGKKADAKALDGGGDDEMMDVDGAVAESAAGAARPKTLEDALGWETTAAVPSVKGVFERVLGIFRWTHAEAEEGS